MLHQNLVPIRIHSWLKILHHGRNLFFYAIWCHLEPNTLDLPRSSESVDCNQRLRVYLRSKYARQHHIQESYEPLIHKRLESLHNHSRQGRSVQLNYRSDFKCLSCRSWSLSRLNIWYQHKRLKHRSVSKHRTFSLVYPLYQPQPVYSKQNNCKPTAITSVRV